jgi:hypothetical protein
LLQERKEREKSEKAVFRDVWEAASKLFENPEQEIAACPVCETPLDRSAKGCREHITLHLQSQLAGLKAYEQATKAVDDARTKVRNMRNDLRSAVSRLQAFLRAAGYLDPHPVLIAAETYGLALASCDDELTLPDSEPLRLALPATFSELDQKRQHLEETQGEHTYGRALIKIDELIGFKESIDHLGRVRGELQRLHDSLQLHEAFCAKEVSSYLQCIIDTLRDRVNTLYRSVHPDDAEAPSIRLELAEDAKEPRLNLLVDFAPNREGVAPSGYLSDSQVHTLALSVRLAAIQLSNTSVPVVVLDDVVTSYDADHRKAIAAMLAHQFNDFQVLLVTHDERFFCYLQDHLPRASWSFKRITGLDADFGPRFHDHKVNEAMIKERWDRGESAANEIRQAEEEWLLEKARQFGVDVRIRDVHHPYSYDRCELAMSLQAFLKNTKVELPRIKGYANPFLASLQKGDVENFGSHFRDESPSRNFIAVGADGP